MMGPSRLVFDPSTVSGHGNVFLLSTTGGPSFGGTDLGGGASAVSLEDMGGVRGAKRRSFFSSPEELILEDEYYDEQLLPEKKRRLTPEQVHLLERSFEAENKLEPERKIELAKKLGLQPRQVAVWFQNRRARWKNKQLEHDFDRLKSLYDALLTDHDSLRSNHESLVADNHRLRSEVMSLTEKLQAKDSSRDGQQPPDEVLVKDDAIPQVAPLPDVQLSTGSAVMDVETVEEPLLVVDSGETYNHTEVVVEVGSYHGACGYVVQSEEDDGSDDNCGYFTGVLASDYAVIEQPLEVELDAMGSDWWVWS